MKSTIFAILLMFITASFAAADYIDDVESMGFISGEGLACGAEKYRAYETIARAYLVSSAESDEQQELGMNKYNEAKARAFLSKRHDGLWDCDETNRRFNAQKIFGAKLYKNGTLKMPDGKIITPRGDYDATLLYDSSRNEREELNALYDKIIEKKRRQAQREGIYEKIKRAEALSR
ncbi:MAG: hypothetical protein IJ864_04860 [Alphaproteobacteria bacterium]|nr:hypothetical protein [Alphaproteobacteria bacterium]